MCAIYYYKLQNNGRIPHVERYILEPVLHSLVCTSPPPPHISPPSLPTDNCVGFLHLWVCFFFLWHSQVCCILDSTCKQCPAASVFLCTTSRLWVHLCCCKWQHFVFSWLSLFHCVSLCGHLFFIHSFVDGSLGYFCILVTVNNAAMNFLGIYLFELVFCFVLFCFQIYTQQWNCWVIW